VDCSLFDELTCSLDFNLTPDDIAYSLMVGETITASQRHAFEYSRVVHISIDPTMHKNYEPKPISEEEAEAQVDQTEKKDPDRVIMHSRPCVLSDGLLDFEELKLLYE
jgi:RNA exonuclease NGL2